MDACNGLQLQLSECIESLKCEVKQKMKDEVGRSRGTKVIEVALAEDFSFHQRILIEAVVLTNISESAVAPMTADEVLCSKAITLIPSPIA